MKTCGGNVVVVDLHGLGDAVHECLTGLSFPVKPLKVFYDLYILTDFDNIKFSVLNTTPCGFKYPLWF